MGEPQWLTSDEQAIWRLYLEVSQRLWARLSRELGEETDVSLAEYDVLVKLSEAPDHSLRMSELAARTTQSRSRLTHTVSRLEREGHVVRNPTSQDRRGVVCTLTDEGLDLLRSAAPSHVNSVRTHFIDQLDGANYEMLHRILVRMAHHLREVDPNKAPFNPTPDGE